jgi:hypothetical protein
MSSSKSENRQRSEQIKARFTLAERALIDERRGPYSRAAWLRNAALAALDLPPERPGRAGIPPADIAAVAELSGAVGRAVGAAVQLAKAIRETGGDLLHGQTEAALAELREQKVALSALIERLSR